MSGDYRVKSRSNSEIRELAKKTRSFFGIADARRVDVIECVKRPTIWTVFGERSLHFRIWSDAEMRGHDGLTSYSKGVVTIALKQIVHDMANMGEGCARQTIAHELGHAVMHDGPPMARGEFRNVTPKWTKPFESAEHQAKVFAPALLINDSIAQSLPSAKIISIVFGISFESADIYFREVITERDRQSNAEKMLHIAAEFRASIEREASQIQYIEEPCSNCGNRTLIPMGIKYLCHTCNSVSDRFQDGDTINSF